MTSLFRGRVKAPFRIVSTCLIGIIIAGVSCREADSPTSPRQGEVPAPAGGPSFLIVCDDQLGCPTGTDTHVSADITVASSVAVTTSSPLYDATVDHDVTSFNETAAPVHVHVDAGYNLAGQVKVATKWTDGADPSASDLPQIVNADLTGDSLTNFNDVGYALTFGTPSEMSATSPMALVGSTQNGSVTAGVLVNTSDTSRFGSSSAPSKPTGFAAGTPSSEMSIGQAIAAAQRSAATTSRLNGVRVSVRMISPDRVEFTDVPDGPSPATRPFVAMADQESASGNGIAHRRIFGRVGPDLWVLAEDSTTVDTQDGQHHTHHVSAMSWRNVRWFINARQDSIRHAARPTTDAIPLSSASTSRGNIRSAAGLHANSLIVCGDDCISGGGGSSGPSPLGQDPGCFVGAAHINAPNPTVNFLYQHGLFSGAGTWCSMDPYLRTRFAVGNEIRHQLSSVDLYQNQASSLVTSFNQDLANGFPGPYVFIGHSNGGVVSRYAAQSLGGDPTKIAGVVTVGSPNAGVAAAKLSSFGLSIAFGLASLTPFACDIVNTFICARIGLLASAGIGGLSEAIQPFMMSSNPVLTQMTPNNSFYSFVNSRGDGFPHAAVVNNSWDKWIEWKVIGDYKACIREGRGANCGNEGHTWANNADRAYHSGIKCAVVSGLLGIVWSGSRRAAAICGAFAAGLKGADLAYRHLLLADDHGDGIVRSASQRYPFAASQLNFDVNDADSHAAEPYSTVRTGVGIARAMNGQFGLPFAQ